MNINKTTIHQIQMKWMYIIIGHHTAFNMKKKPTVYWKFSIKAQT